MMVLTAIMLIECIIAACGVTTVRAAEDAALKLRKQVRAHPLSCCVAIPFASSPHAATASACCYLAPRHTV